MEGWIKVFRQLIDWEWYSDTVTVRVFLHLLLIANYEEKKWRGITIQRGQTFTSYEKIQKGLKDKKISIKNIRTAINHLKSAGNVAVKPASNGLLVTIVNYDKYQFNYIETADKVADNWADNGQTTGNNIRKKRNKEVKNNIISLHEINQKDLESLYEN